MQEFSLQFDLFGPSFDHSSNVSQATSETHKHGPDDLCPICEKDRAQALCNPEKLRTLKFDLAADFWLLNRERSLKPRTFYGYTLHVKNLNKFFGNIIVEKIHIGNILNYQRARTTNEGTLWGEMVGSSIINHEVVTLGQVLGLAGEWKKIEAIYKPLPKPRRQKPRVMSDEEEMRLFAVASSCPEWQLAYLIASIGVNTGAVGSELRNLTLGDLHLDVRVPGFVVAQATAKNEYRGRWVPLNPTALKHMRVCVEIANSKGSHASTDYLFPFRLCRGHFDPARPATASLLRRQWKDMVTCVGLPHITPHCMRHQHATISLEAGESEFTVAKRLGHRNPTMLREVYGHGREDQQSAAVANIDPSVRFAPKREAGNPKVRAIR